MASLFVIREKNTNTYCTGSNRCTFNADLQSAAMFNKRENAEKAARTMFAKADKGEVNRYGGWTWEVYNEDGTVQHFHHAHLKAYIELLRNSTNDHTDRIKWIEEEVKEQRCEMEVLEVKLSLI